MSRRRKTVTVVGDVYRQVITHENCDVLVVDTFRDGHKEVRVRGRRGEVASSTPPFPYDDVKDQLTAILYDKIVFTSE